MCYVILLSSGLGNAQNDYSLHTSIATYGCSNWLLDGIQFGEAMDSIRSIYPSAQLAKRLYHFKDGDISLKEEMSVEDRSYVKKLMNIFARDLRDILFIEKEVTIEVLFRRETAIEDGNLTPQTVCEDNTTYIDIHLVSKLFLESLERAIIFVNKFEMEDIPPLTPSDFFEIWSQDYGSAITSQEDGRNEAIKMNRIAYYTSSEFYRFFIFTLAHETYHIISKCKQSRNHEMKADLLGAVVFQFLYRYITYEHKGLWECIFGDLEGYQETEVNSLVEFLYGLDVNYVFDALYRNTALGHGGTYYLPVEERETFISKNINEVHINKLYNNYEKIIKRYNRR